MKLEKWLFENSGRLSRDLIQSGKERLSGSGMLSCTIRSKAIEVLNELRSVLLPGIYDNRPVSKKGLESVINKRIFRAAFALREVIKSVTAGCFERSLGYAEKADDAVMKIIESLPEIRRLLESDIKAAYEGDPAARSYEEVVLSYPSIEAVGIYRIAHVFWTLRIPVIPRIMTEYAHKNTGIDIHPGAKIGESFFIDHGTGVVIGETCTIGKGVKLYQGVTLGAKSFPLDENGNPVKGIKRHPDIEDNVVIYSGATILGGDTRIGHDSVIGGNVWLTESVPPFSTVFNAQPAPVIKNAV